MNRLTLVLNTAILVVTFVVALAAGDVQGELLTSAARTVGQRRGARGGVNDSSAALVRVVQSMENFYPPTAENKLTLSQLESIRDAIEVYYAGMRAGVNDVLSGTDESADVRGAIAQLGKTVRVDIEASLSHEFSDPSIVRRLTTEVIRNCR